MVLAQYGMTIRQEYLLQTGMMSLLQSQFVSMVRLGKSNSLCIFQTTTPIRLIRIEMAERQIGLGAWESEPALDGMLTMF